MQTYNPSFQEAEAGRAQVQGQPGLHRGTKYWHKGMEGKGKETTKQNSYSTVQNTG